MLRNSTVSRNKSRKALAALLECSCIIQVQVHDGRLLAWTLGATTQRVTARQHIVTQLLEPEAAAAVAAAAEGVKILCAF